MLVQHTRLAVHQQMLLFVSSVMQDDFTLQDYNIRNGEVVLQMKDPELLASAGNQPGQWDQQQYLQSQSTPQQSNLDSLQLAFPSGLRICRVCRLPSYFQRGWCFNINCGCKGNASTALSQQWLCEKQQQTQQSHPDTPQLVLPPFGIRQCSMCRQWTYLRKGWCCNANCSRKD